MDFFRIIMKFMAYGAVAFSLSEAYLSLNKLWKRKHEKVVAESISISAVSIGLFSSMVYSIDLTINRAWPSFIDALIWLVFGLFELFVAIGFWVTGERRSALWKMMKKTYHQERKEIGELAQSVIQPSHKKVILDILIQFSMLDNKLAKAEKVFIQEFANRWNIDLDWQQIKQDCQQKENHGKIRENIIAYLKTSPPAQQVSQFGDILRMLIHIDQDIDEREQSMMDEVSRLIEQYVPSEECPQYYAAVVPQALGQEDSVKTIFPHLKKQEKVLGGYAYLDGPFFSEQFIVTVCKKYQKVDLFAIPVRSDQLFE
uniref:hypothetical protein n=1 Tax=Candidatus Electrothrix sp. TaxID=2170559 RepID=UPI0040562BF8